MSQRKLMEFDHEAPISTSVKANVARVLVAALTNQCKAYCMLSGYEGLPQTFDTDIDFMVDEEDFRRMPRILEGVASQTSTKLFQAVDHEVTGRAYFLGSTEGPSLITIQPDCASDYRHFGRLWLRAGEVLAGRRWHPNGFWIPSAAHEFIYYLIKRLNKRDFKSEHGAKLRRLYAEDRVGCGRMVARFWNGPEAAALTRMAGSNDWAEMGASLEVFRAALMRTPSESLSQKLASIPLRALHFIQRILQPTGSWIAFMGPDGCGKSLILNAVGRELAPAFRSVRCYHMRPRVVGRKPTSHGPVTDPHGQVPRGVVASVAKVLDLAADYVLGYASKILPGLIRTQLVLFDRCFYDLLVDSKRIRYGGPRWLLHLAARIAPRPELVILLDAPAEVLWARKREVPFEEVVRQRDAYLQLARSLPSTVIVDASQAAGEVIHDAVQTIVESLSRRTAERLHSLDSHGRTGRMGAKAPGQR